MSADPAPLIEAIDVHKRHGRRIAVDGVSLAVGPGRIVALLGPNGAGKTTMLSMLATLLPPDSGEIRLAAAPRKVSLGLVPQSLALYPTLTVEENVRHFARMQGVERRRLRPACDDALEAVGLGGRRGDPVQSLSGGMKRRLNLACGIVHRPALLLLDEPTVGVDLESREHILALVLRLREAGAAVIYSTHLIEEVERICDRVLLIDRGRLVADGSVAEIVALAGERSRLELACREPPRAGWARGLEGLRELDGAGGEGSLVLELAEPALVGAVLERLREVGAAVVDFSLQGPNLARAFGVLTGRALANGDEG